jgi:hypothetical protein
MSRAWLEGYSKGRNKSPYDDCRDGTGKNENTLRCRRHRQESPLIVKRISNLLNARKRVGNEVPYRNDNCDHRNATSSTAQ